MFGIRPDGRRIKNVDPIVMFTPYVMPTRNDAQNFCKQTIDYDTLANYIKKKRGEGHVFSFMTIVIAAYLRTVSQCPELNRFIANKQIFARNRISVSFVVLKNTHGETIEESLVKLELNATDTIYDVDDKMRRAIEHSRESSMGTLTDRFARILLSIPGLATLIVAIARLLDRYGLLPGLIYDASPFHTTLFITNMASINMTYIYHHLYNFGTTSVFLALGKRERAIVPLSGGGVTYKNQLPLGVVTDERIAGGASYAKAFRVLSDCLNDPSALENPPQSVKYEVEMRPARDVNKR
ncbi:MAG: hypothetical protein Q4D04_01745 [Clostridia bacterium]|nr:hypothetical protein [Clostridia bacterium]